MTEPQTPNTSDVSVGEQRCTTEQKYDNSGETLINSYRGRSTQELPEQNHVQKETDPAVFGFESIRLALAAVEEMMQSQHSKDTDVKVSLRAEIQRIQRKHQKQTELYMKKCKQADGYRTEVEGLKRTLQTATSSHNVITSLLDDQKIENSRLAQLCVDLQSKLDRKENKTEENISFSLMEYQEKLDSMQELVDEVTRQRSAHLEQEKWLTDNRIQMQDEEIIRLKDLLKREATTNVNLMEQLESMIINLGTSQGKQAESTTLWSIPFTFADPLKMYEEESKDETSPAGNKKRAAQNPAKDNESTKDRRVSGVLTEAEWATQMTESMVQLQSDWETMGDQHSESEFPTSDVEEKLHEEEETSLLLKGQFSFEQLYTPRHPLQVLLNVCEKRCRGPSHEHTKNNKNNMKINTCILIAFFGMASAWYIERQYTDSNCSGSFNDLVYPIGGCYQVNSSSTYRKALCDGDRFGAVYDFGTSSCTGSRSNIVQGCQSRSNGTYFTPLCSANFPTVNGSDIIIATYPTSFGNTCSGNPSLIQILYGVGCDGVDLSCRNSTVGSTNSTSGFPAARSSNQTFCGNNFSSSRLGTGDVNNNTSLNLIPLLAIIIAGLFFSL
ncbi:effector protein B, substrate of the Dot/Icm secretion system [Planoprotostelium fungivorum]|uniref:Effector protein B, substrate of the Dot/Icm secretion system n=1 Tax=Planoprotostelium fungivorum TaxID=1890364 RepID=A0A2P6MWG5_9EUKA|nr:effector protein B, substrate of the Dot/Icm secretion system [Planoprotostelium fungivorum]